MTPPITAALIAPGSQSGQRGPGETTSTGGGSNTSVLRGPGSARRVRSGSRSEDAAGAVGDDGEHRDEVERHVGDDAHAEAPRLVGDIGQEGPEDGQPGQLLELPV